MAENWGCVIFFKQDSMRKGLPLTIPPPPLRLTPSSIKRTNVECRLILEHLAEHLAKYALQNKQIVWF